MENQPQESAELKVPEFIFIDREDLEWLKKIPGIANDIMCEYSPDTQFITKTEAYFHRSKIVEMQDKQAKDAAKIAELQEREKVLVEALEIYADKNNFDADLSRSKNEWNGKKKKWFNFGDSAREALSKIKGEK